MTKYAYYDPTVMPNHQVIGWIDSDVEKNMPPIGDLLEITDDQWAARTSDCFCVVDGALMGSKNIISIAKSVQLGALSNCCQQQIISGFSSSALGAVHNYASDAVDQRNILLAAQSTGGGLLSCQGASDIWVRVPHTQPQAQQVVADFVAASDTARTKLSGLEAQIEAATTVEAVKAIVWNSNVG